MTRRMSALAKGVNPKFNSFVGFVSGQNNDRQNILALKQTLQELREMLQDPALFVTSIDINHKDSLDDSYNDYVRSMSDPTTSQEDVDKAALALLEDIECRAEANKNSDDPRKARAGEVLMTQINNTRTKNDRASMIMSAKSLAVKMEKMKLVCDSLDPADTTVSRDMGDVTDELLQDLCGKLDEL